MDKRIIKTQETIYKAFEELLKEKSYNNLVIQDILDKCKIARSTFYSHYKTKEDLLKSILNNIFSHCFSPHLLKEKTHNFSDENIKNYKHIITHILYHLLDEKELIKAIISNDCRETFFEELRKKVLPLTEKIAKEKLEKNKSIPYKLTLEANNEMFIVLVKHWFSFDCQKSPEEISKYYFLLIEA